jgi:hypothetical protein
MMKNKPVLKIFLAALFVCSAVTYGGCKKQAKCGCGKDVVQNLTEVQVMVQYNASSNTAIFYPVYSTGATYYFCNPGQWMDSLKKLNTADYLLLTGKAYYECNYLMQASNYSYLPPVYQVEVTGIRADNYGK